MARPRCGPPSSTSCSSPRAPSSLELGIEQIRLTASSPLCGRSLAAANVRQRFGVVVVGIQRAGGKMEFNPPPEAEMNVGDHLVVMGRPDTLKQLEGAAARRQARRER